MAQLGGSFVVLFLPGHCSQVEGQTVCLLLGFLGRLEAEATVLALV